MRDKAGPAAASRRAMSRGWRRWRRRCRPAAGARPPAHVDRALHAGLPARRNRTPGAHRGTLRFRRTANASRSCRASAASSPASRERSSHYAPGTGGRAPAQSHDDAAVRHDELDLRLAARRRGAGYLQALGGIVADCFCGGLPKVLTEAGRSPVGDEPWPGGHSRRAGRQPSGRLAATAERICQERAPAQESAAAGAAGPAAALPAATSPRSPRRPRALSTRAGPADRLRQACRQRSAWASSVAQRTAQRRDARGCRRRCRCLRALARALGLCLQQAGCQRRQNRLASRGGPSAPAASASARARWLHPARLGASVGACRPCTAFQQARPVGQQGTSRMRRARACETAAA